MHFTNINLMGLQFSRLDQHVGGVLPRSLFKIVLQYLHEGQLANSFVKTAHLSMPALDFLNPEGLKLFYLSYYLHLGDPDLGYIVINVLSCKCIWKYSFNASPVLVS